MTFAAGHRLYNPDFPDEKNREIFGDCANVNAHGHNYVLFVSVSGEIDPETGMIVNLKEMKNVLQKEVIDRVDHKNLNLDVSFMKDIIPTTENFAAQIWKVLEQAFRGVTLEKIVLWESENNKVEISR
jgi:6-pyruvoyltetrahydropterin/6-carboxytetrahydropterin synthase